MRYLLLSALIASPLAAQKQMPELHHVGLNTVDPDRAIAWYLKVWPSAKRTSFANLPGVQGDMLVLFTKVDRAPSGQWRDDLHRSEPQSAFWHIGANINTTDMQVTLAT